MVPRVPEDAFIALLRRAYHSTRTCSVGRRNLSSLVTRSPPTYLPSARTASLLAASRTTTRHYATTTTTSSSDKNGVASSANPKHIAVLGGGITGLTTAHYLARYAGPHVYITLFEASDRLGGWIDAERAPAGGMPGSEVLLQRGPRMLRSGAGSLRYDDLVLYDVVRGAAKQNTPISSSCSSKRAVLIFH